MYYFNVRASTMKQHNYFEYIINFDWIIADTTKDILEVIEEQRQCELIKFTTYTGGTEFFK